jgi:hypothetical protein
MNGICRQAAVVLFTFFVAVTIFRGVFPRKSTNPNGNETVALAKFAAASPSRPPAPPLVESPWTFLVVLTTQTSLDAIGYNGIPRHESGPFCSERPGGTPLFGEQCTMQKRDALRACLHLVGCTSLTAPDEAPYGDRPDLGTKGPLAQARSTRALSWATGETFEQGHGMCEPSGCESVWVTRVPKSHLAPELVAALDQLASAHSKSIVKKGSLLIAAPRSAPPSWLSKWGLESENLVGHVERQSLKLAAVASNAPQKPWVLGPECDEEEARSLGFRADDPSAVYRTRSPPSEWAVPASELAIYHHAQESSIPHI